MKKKLAWILLALGLGCLALYLALVIKTNLRGLIAFTLLLSILLNGCAANLFLTAFLAARRERGRTDE